MNYKEVLIYIEITPDLKIAPVVFEIASEGKKLANKLSNGRLTGVIINDLINYEKIIDQLSYAGFEKLYLIKNIDYKNYATRSYANAICELIKDIKPEILLFGATRIGRDLAPRVSSRLNLGLTADCTALDINEKGLLAATRPTFGGQLMATILSKTLPQMATIRPNVFKKNDFVKNKRPEIEEKFYSTTHAINHTELIDFQSFVNNKENITDAEVIVAGGLGMKNKEGFELLTKFAEKINAKVGATRAAVEAGLADASIQIGQTGKTVSPKIYIACGISGAIQHIVGFTMAKKVVAINSDANAPIFKYADYGIVDDVFKVLPQLIKEMGGEND